MLAAKAHSPEAPAVFVTEADYDRLAPLIRGLRAAGPGGLLLEEELDRASLVGPRTGAAAFVRLGSTVEYEDMSTGQVRRVQVVLPAEASIDENRISVLTPVGAALLGVTVGRVFHWTQPDGRIRSLRVLAVTEERH